MDENDNPGTENPPAAGVGNPPEPKPAQGNEGRDSGGDAEAERLRRQLKDAESKLTAFQKAEAKRKEAELSDLEREKAKRAELESELESERQKRTDFAKRSAFVLAATKAGAKNPDSAYKLADLSVVEVDDSGNVSGVDTAIKALQKTDDYLFGSPTPTPTRQSGGNPKSGPPNGELTPEQILTMPSDDYRKRIESFRAQHY